MNEIEDRIRSGCITYNPDNPYEEYYRTVFIGRNFYVYRFVRKGRGYRGDTYPEDGYVLAWADIQDAPNHKNIPTFITRRG